MNSRAYMAPWILSSVSPWVPTIFSLISAFPFFRFSVVGSLVAKNDLKSLVIMFFTTTKTVMTSLLKKERKIALNL